MKLGYLILLVLPFHMGAARAEGGCPPGQYPIGGQGAVSCAPIPQDKTKQPPPQPAGKWIDSWGAIAIGSIDSTTSYGVTTGKLSKAEAESDALKRCASHGEKNCQVGLSYYNQCAVIAEPQINGKPLTAGFSRFVGAATVKKASSLALKRCEKDNKIAPQAECKIIYQACSDSKFQEF